MFGRALLILLLALWLPLAQAALDPVGQVVVASGGVTARGEDGSSRPLRRRSEVFAGDTVLTDAQGRAQIRLVDGELLDLRPDTELKFDQLVFEGAGADANSNVKTLVKGGLRAITGAVGGEQYRVNTRAATIGIRGTSYELLSPDGVQLYAGVTRGGIVVDNGQGRLLLGVGANYNYGYVGSNQSPPQGQLNRPPGFTSSEPEAGPPGGFGGGAGGGSGGGGLGSPGGGGFGGGQGAPGGGLGDGGEEELPPVNEFKGAPIGDSGSGGGLAGGGVGDGGNDPSNYVEPPTETPVEPTGTLHAVAAFGNSTLAGGATLSGAHLSSLDTGAGSVLAQGSAPLESLHSDSGFNVSWGVWNADSAHPATLSSGSGSSQVTEPVYWIASVATPSSELPTGSAGYGQLSGFLGYSSLTGQVSLGSSGEICDITIDVNFNSLSFSGNMDLTFQSGNRVDLWQASFGGDIDGSTLTSTSLTGSYTQHQLDQGSTISSGIAGSVQGNFVGSSGGGIAGGYSLHTTDTGVTESTSGVFLLQR